MSNRERTHRVHFRLTDQEKDYLDNKLQQLNISNREAYCRKMVLEGQIIQIDTQPVKEVRRLLANLTNNMNQIAKHANETGSVHDTELMAVIEECHSFRSTINHFETLLLNLQKPSTHQT